MSLFCEDIRTEKSEQHTLVGVMKDSLSVPSLEGSLTRLSIYTRFNADADFTVDKLSISFKDSAGTTVVENTISKDLMDDARKKANERNSPSYGIISIFQVAMFPLSKEGVYPVVCTVDGNDSISGYLNVQVNPESSSISPNAP
jgi:hypothetical protein